MKKINKILIANRGEIALRVISTCKEMGIATVAIFTDEERELPHVIHSDEAIAMGSGTINETYLNGKKIIAMAINAKADAIHPGYGFLSENAEFSELVKQAGLIFIGPSAESMRLMGDKIRSKESMRKLGIPVIPGILAQDLSDQELLDQSKKMGFPVIIKASAGGGGKGMRVVQAADTFFDDLESTRREARHSFGNDALLIEKYLDGPRHIEVQLLSDSHGNHLHFYERECSIQRRHQKIVEETPSLALNAQQRQDICETAVKISSAINYEGVGTVEFVLDRSGTFYFLEMNTRLQVEHPVTEYLTGHDLVRLQIEVAQGDKITLAQSDIRSYGAAIEVRLYAEDPDNDFLPTIGQIVKVGHPTLKGVRLESGYMDGNEVTINFDPLLAKIVAWSENRQGAINKILQTLLDVPFLGIKTNRSYLQRILRTEIFKKGDFDTNFVVTHKDKLAPPPVGDLQKAKALAAYQFLKSKYRLKSEIETERSRPVWDEISEFRNC